ncbi:MULTISPECIES: energy transducer TonB [Pseudoxanthomonas]|uniref:Protein TonB n=1 Tax=Pseudoxanthomonas winnipegensis TaxID=2480810 RepID=A0AAW8G8A9_9GAMM|nr:MULTISPECIES: energy transducer TonB [Pseudoxanthomonas]MDQ1118596.1 protein TonB [Pseudoxanthomonas winnipegensis]MDQ1131780.1 protein TonB [Pseudoxanthomonas winnipegensis]MDR6138200.1 protein TonB [Pseudoxanthomonas sp. SORGH_AS_0997]
MVRTLPYGPEGRVNVARISGIAAAMLVHALAFMLLLIPATLPPLARTVQETKPDFELIHKPVEATVAPPPKPTPARPAPTQRTTPAPTPITVSRPVDVPVAATQTMADPAPATVAEPTAVDTGAIQAPSGPLASASLSYVHAPAPAYPRSAIASHAEGTVILRVLVDVDGTPLEATIETSSGNRDLDRAARMQVLKAWKFQPAMQDGHAVQAYGRVPVDFSLR